MKLLTFTASVAALLLYKSTEIKAQDQGQTCSDALKRDFLKLRTSVIIFLGTHWERLTAAVESNEDIPWNSYLLKLAATELNPLLANESTKPILVLEREDIQERGIFDGILDLLDGILGLFGTATTTPATTTTSAITTTTAPATTTTPVTTTTPPTGGSTTTPPTGGSTTTPPTGGSTTTPSTGGSTTTPSTGGSTTTQNPDDINISNCTIDGIVSDVIIKGEMLEPLFLMLLDEQIYPGIRSNETGMLSLINQVRRGIEGLQNDFFEFKRRYASSGSIRFMQ